MSTEFHALLELLAMLLLDLRTGLLLALLVAAAVIDWRTMRIPNWLTAGGTLAGLLVSAATAPTLLSGLGTSAGGAAAGLLLLLPLYMLRVLGAGDVKLMAMVGAFLGPTATLGAALSAAAAGGVLALAWSAHGGKTRQLLANLRFMAVCLLHPSSGAARHAAPAALPSVGKLPYGVGICLGTTAFLLARQFA